MKLTSQTSALSTTASLSPVPGKGKAKKTKGGSGPSSTGSFAKLSPNGSWSKMYRGCYLLTLEGSLLEYCETFPKAGMMQNGILYRLPALEHRTSEKECSLWRTPNSKVVDAKANVVKLTGRTPKDPQVGLADQVMAAERCMWPTPTKSDGMGGPGCSGRDGGANLRTAVQSFPTPAARDYRSPNKNGNMADQLPNVVGGSLNADWVELLMGFSRGWTDLGAKDGKMGFPESSQAKKTE